MCAFNSIVLHSCSTQRLGRLVRQGVTRPVFRCLQLLAIMVDTWYMLAIQCDLRSLWDLVRPLLPPEAVVRTWVSCRRCRRIGRSLAMAFLVQSWSQEETVVALENEAFALPRFLAWDVALLLRRDRRDSVARCYKHVFYAMCILCIYYTILYTFYTHY